jgi:toxin ParE1/3/4
MRSSPELEFSLRAATDIAEILQYSLVNWGIEHRDDYAESLERAFETIVSLPEIGPLYRDDPPLRAYEVREHIVFYEIRESTLYVQRVLHKKMRALANLSE